MLKSEALQYIRSHWKVSDSAKIKEMLEHYFAMPDDITDTGQMVSVGIPIVVPVISSEKLSALEILSSPLLEN